MWKKFVQWRVEQANPDRIPVHRFEDSLEVRALHRQQLRQRAASAGCVPGDDHLPHGSDAVALEEHVLGAAQSDAFGAEPAGDASVAWRICVRSDAHRPDLVRPAKELGVRLVDGSGGALQITRCHPHDLARNGRQMAGKDASGCAVQRQPVAFRYLRAIYGEAASLEVNLDLLAANDGALTHTARDNRCMTCHSPASGEHGTRGYDSGKVFRGGLVAHEYHVVAGGGTGLGAIGVEHRDAALGARARREPGAKWYRANGGVDDWMQ